MSAPLNTIRTDPTLPAEADVVIVGAGIVGVSAAYWLARGGMKVVLLEKGSVGAEQSSRNWGWCRQQNRDARELPLSTRSLSLWEDMTTDIGETLGFKRCGLLYLTNDQAELDGWDRWGIFARGEGVDTRMLSPSEAARRGHATQKKWLGGVWSPSDGIADPSLAAPMIAKGVLKHGGHVIQNCAARGVELSAGAVCGVITERGTIRTRQVVMAGGVWARSFLNQLGINFPQASVRSSILSVKPGATGLPDALHTTNASVTKRGDGGYTLAISGNGRVDPTPGILKCTVQFLPMFAKRWRQLAPGGLQAWRYGFDTNRKWSLEQPTPMETTRILDPRPDKNTLRATLENAQALLPELKNAAIQAQWAGYIDSTPDGVPIIDGNSGISGLLVAAGFSGHGFGIGPGAGHLVADIILGRTPITEIKQYKLSRFKRTSWGKVSDF
ncbi:NAD(P)/FAD-dependent oxidoreductase [Gluconobacter wancherniae]|uniref:D-amino-acid oxidase n=1 Tax=Gluconobacter wancherniae NBRC 103581 TaxID=656744 RepID=A0A511B290_9PROT|nr:FAD-binding oxidoreductase [Gluconobacter wancherniae]MBF0854823.1 FAD-binding oxidoreductase [Gluconobacter wancherniae]GBD57894.1 D-amino-acid oxidase [Gluconobacter wancherniae NBRC 103581]GEK94579.1 D-amino-acid oxidase [Gluconobacter wancherniae NBRC 103581]